MAFPANQISFLLLLLSVLFVSYSQARDSQLFSKLPTTTNVNKPDDQSEFKPDNDNGYGLYGHDSAHLPPSSAVPQDTGSGELPPRKYLPKNYNSVAYVTEPEDVNDSVSFTGDDGKFSSVDPANYYTGANEASYIPRPKQEEDEEEPSSAYRTFPTSANVAGGGSSFNSEPTGTRAYDTGAALYRSEGYYNGNGGGFRPEGMSDTRTLADGKYFYDLNSEKYNSNHPYESLKSVRPASYDRNTVNYGNGDGVVYGSHGERYGPEFQQEWNDLP